MPLCRNFRPLLYAHVCVVLFKFYAQTAILECIVCCWVGVYASAVWPLLLYEHLYMGVMRVHMYLLFVSCARCGSMRDLSYADCRYGFMGVVMNGTDIFPCVDLSSTSQLQVATLQGRRPSWLGIPECRTPLASALAFPCSFFSALLLSSSCIDDIVPCLVAGCTGTIGCRRSCGFRKVAQSILLPVS